ncbi:MAG TPA: cation diffusion facilitator family transporter, partial [Pirellulaceae bacterium]|nr:cation diffusion facilitator family transporter [Pirellulaceae bacterium]
VHDAGDTLSLGLSWVLERFSLRERDDTFTYGYRRFSVLGAMLSGLVLIVGLSLVMFTAVPRLWHPQPVYSPGMAALAILGIVANGLAFLRLRRGKSFNVQVVAWHLLEDVLGWVAILIGSIVMMVWEVPILDPLLSVGISLFVLWNVVRKLARVGLVFLQSAPEGFDLGRFTEQVLAIPRVQSLHHTHVWTLDGQRHVLTTHLVMDAGSTRDDIIAAKSRLIELLQPEPFTHATIAVELAGEKCEGTVEHDGCGAGDGPQPG